MKKPESIEQLQSENARMRDLLNRRPALNDGLVEAYIQWTSLCYQSDEAAARIAEMKVH